MKRYAIAPLAMALAACTTPPSPATPTALPPTVGMANPASVHCVQLGGKVEIERTPAGERGYCILPSGERVDEWELFRRSR